MSYRRWLCLLCGREIDRRAHNRLMHLRWHERAGDLIITDAATARYTKTDQGQIKEANMVGSKS